VKSLFQKFHNSSKNEFLTSGSSGQATITFCQFCEKPLPEPKSTGRPRQFCLECYKINTEKRLHNNYLKRKFKTEIAGLNEIEAKLVIQRKELERDIQLSHNKEARFLNDLKHGLGGEGRRTRRSYRKEVSTWTNDGIKEVKAQFGLGTIPSPQLSRYLERCREFKIRKPRKLSIHPKLKFLGKGRWAIIPEHKIKVDDP
jgi:hypothetical protein